MSTTLPFDERRRPAWELVAPALRALRANEARAALGLFLLGYAVAPLALGILVATALSLAPGLVSIPAGQSAAFVGGRVTQSVQLPLEAIVLFAVYRFVVAAGAAVSPRLRRVILASVASSAVANAAALAGSLGGWDAHPAALVLLVNAGSIHYASFAMMQRQVFAIARRPVEAWLAAALALAQGVVLLASSAIALVPTGVRFSWVPWHAAIALGLWLLRVVLALQLRGVLRAVPPASADTFA